MSLFQYLNMETVIHNFDSEQKLFVFCLKSLLNDRDKMKCIKDLRIMEVRLCEYISQLDEMVLVTRETRKPVILRIQNLQENVDLVLESFAESTERDIAEIDKLVKQSIEAQEKYIKLSEEHTKMKLANQRLRDELAIKVDEVERHKKEITEIRRKLLELAKC
jgi:hypothetical protein